jgi:hypothetical protein
MPFELRIHGRRCGEFATEQEATNRARDLLRETPDLEPEIIDMSTGRAAAPGASKRDRDELAKRIGY